MALFNLGRPKFHLLK